MGVHPLARILAPFRLQAQFRPRLAGVTDDGQDSVDTLAERAALVSKLTHEIRGPVSTIRGLAGTTLAHYDRLDDGERREFLELIRHEAERLERTVEQVALALKLDAGTLRFDIRMQDLGVIVRGAADAAETGDHPLEVDTDEQVEAPVDSIQVAFVVRQLLENAAMFSPADTPISVRLTSEGDHALIHVLDRGPGIPDGERDGVFERFAALAPRRLRGSTGNGARTVHLPRDRAGTRGRRFDRGRSRGGYDARHPASPGGTNGGLPVTTLLICDDHKVLTDALSTVVGLDDDLQLVAAPVHDPETAIELSAEHLPDVVLMDIVFKGRHVRDRGDPPDQGDLARDEGRDHDRARRGSAAGGGGRGRRLGVPREGRGCGGGPRGREGGGRG